MKDNQPYDIFISYRRTGGAQYARILQLMLIQRGYKVFLDYDELTDGIFSDKIKAAIKEAPVFMLVLSKNSMQRCDNEGDWVRQEITLALEQQKKIIPINPDNGFDGFPEGMPQNLQNAIGSHQHSEISFGQALGATIDLMIKNRLVPTLGPRTPQEHKDEDFDTANKSLNKLDAQHRFMKWLGVAGVVAVVLIVLGTCYLFWEKNDKKQQLESMRTELEKKYSDFGLYLSNDLTMQQMTTLDNMLGRMVPVRPDTLWMSQFECTVGWWHGVMGEAYDEAEANMPMTEVSFGEINMTYLDTLRNMTNLEFDLPSAEEWEYAAHGAWHQEQTTYAGSNNVDSVAWYQANSNGHAHPCDGQQNKIPNMLDLYDMSGNVAEWCNTPIISATDGAQWTVCGGHYNSPVEEVAISSRAGLNTDAKEKTVGFRLVIRKAQP
jgi:hypothetical protein